MSYGALGGLAVGVTDRPQNTVETCSNMLKRSVTMDNISNYNKDLQGFVARDSFTMLNLYIGIASINWLRCDRGLENMSWDISSLQWWPQQESRRLFGFHMVCKPIVFLFSMFSVCLHLFRPSWDYVLIYSSEMCVFFFFRGGIFDDLCKSDTPFLNLCDARCFKFPRQYQKLPKQVSHWNSSRSCFRHSAFFGILVDWGS